MGRRGLHNEGATLMRARLADKITLIDTVKHYLYYEMIARISTIVDPKKIDPGAAHVLAVRGLRAVDVSVTKLTAQKLGAALGKLTRVETLLGIFPDVVSACRAVINTLPLNEAALMLEPGAPGDVQAWSNLNDVEVVVYNYWIDSHMRIAAFTPATRPCSRPLALLITCWMTGVPPGNSQSSDCCRAPTKAATRVIGVSM